MGYFPSVTAGCNRTFRDIGCDRQTVGVLGMYGRVAGFGMFDAIGSVAENPVIKGGSALASGERSNKRICCSQLAFRSCSSYRMSFVSARERVSTQIDSLG
jgi:hypothetical protein